MSKAPNKSYDPVQVTSLSADEVDRARGRRSPPSAAASQPVALKQVRLDHADRSPLAFANREIGALPPHAKAEPGKRSVRPEAL